MGITPDDKIDRWMVAAKQKGKGGSVLKRVIRAGEFLEKNARMREADACKCLSGIDFSKDVKVIRLPIKVYVQYVSKHKGHWFTDTGLTPDAVGLADGKRVRKLFRPSGSIHALQSTARGIKDTWTRDRLFQSLSPDAKKKMGQLTRGGGTQYFVAEKSRMRPV